MSEIEMMDTIIDYCYILTPATYTWKWTYIEMFARGVQIVLDIHVRM